MIDPTVMDLYTAFLELKLETQEDLDGYAIGEGDEVMACIHACNNAMHMIVHMAPIDVMARWEEFRSIWDNAGGEPAAFPELSILEA